MHLDTYIHITGPDADCQKKRCCHHINAESGCRDIMEARSKQSGTLPATEARPAIRERPRTRGPAIPGHAFVVKQSARQQHSCQGHCPLERP